MDDRFDLTLDCIILGLQRFGGISIYWNRLVQATAGRDRPVPGLLMPKGGTDRDFDTAFLRDREVRFEILLPSLTRYLPSQVLPGSEVFPTS